MGAIIQSEESRRNLMLASPVVENSSMIAGKSKNGQEKKVYLWCTYYNKAWHTQENCWKLRDKPTNRELGQKGGTSGGVSWRSGQVYVAEKNEEKANSSSLLESTSLSQEEIERMRAFFSSLEKPSGACTLAYSGMLPLIWI